MKRLGVPAVLMFSCLLCPVVGAETPKLVTVDEVISKSLAAIASPPDRAAVRYFELTGTAKISAAVAGLDTTGTALLLSEGNKVKFALKSKLYSSDQFVFDGKEVKVTKDPRGGRSPLGDFIWHQGALLRDGLLGGVLSTAWPLYQPKLPNNAKLNYEGVKQVDGVNVHVLSYTSKNVDSSTMKVKLLFDGSTFRHIRTTYDLLEMSVDAAGWKLRPDSIDINRGMDANYGPTHYILEETFSDFRQLGSYVLPLHEKLSLITDTGSGNWSIDVTYNNLNGNDLSAILR